MRALFLESKKLVGKWKIGTHPYFPRISYIVYREEERAIITGGWRMVRGEEQINPIN